MLVFVFLVFVVVEIFYGNGFIVVFMVGLFFIGVSDEVCRNIESFGKVEGE